MSLYKCTKKVPGGVPSGVNKRYYSIPGKEYSRSTSCSKITMRGMWRDMYLEQPCYMNIWITDDNFKFGFTEIKPMMDRQIINLEKPRT